MTTERAVIDTTEQVKGPSLQESHDALVKEGVIAGEEGQQENTGGDTGASQGEENAGGAEERPSWLPEKFKTPEDMAKAYAELEKKQSQGSTNDEGTTQGDTTNTEGEQAAQEAVENAGLDWDSLTAEYEADGSLSDVSYAKLEKAGVPKELVDNYINGVQAQTAIYEGKVQGFAENYDALLEWGGANLSEAEIDTFDAAVNSGNLAQAEIAVKGLQARMQIAQGMPPARQLDGKGGSSSDLYESQAQIEADMNDPRYESDPAFRAKVYAKMERSNV